MEPSLNGDPTDTRRCIYCRVDEAEWQSKDAFGHQASCPEGVLGFVSGIPNDARATSAAAVEARDRDHGLCWCAALLYDSY